MMRSIFILLASILIWVGVSYADMMDIFVRGVDDGIRTNQQQDYKEAVANAKLKVIEKAEEKIQANTKEMNLETWFNMVEIKANTILLPGFQIMDMGYSVKGTYQIVLWGRIIDPKDGFEISRSKALRHAKSLVERRKRDEGKKIITDIIDGSGDEMLVAEAMGYQVLWQLTINDREALEKLRAYYPDYKYLNRLESIVSKREKTGKEKFSEQDGRYVAYSSGLVEDSKTDLEWIAGPDKNTNWYQAKRWVENLNVGGGGWRMPAIKELKSLFLKKDNTGNITPLLKMTGSWVWSGETQDTAYARAVFFFNGNDDKVSCLESYNGRGFAVRPTK